jgi:hypothetical protein
MGQHVLEDSTVELVRWAEPVLGDVLASGYAAHITDAKVVGPIVRCHVLIWRCVLSGDSRMEAFHEALARMTRRTGVSDQDIEELNREVLRELLHVIAIRYQRSPRSAGHFSMEVARAACRLTALRKPGQN